MPKFFINEEGFPEIQLKLDDTTIKIINHLEGLNISSRNKKPYDNFGNILLTQEHAKQLLPYVKFFAENGVLKND